MKLSGGGQISGQNTRLIINAVGIAIRLISDHVGVVNIIRIAHVAHGSNQPRREHVKAVIHAQVTGPRATGSGAPFARHTTDHVATLALEPIDNVGTNCGGPGMVGIIETKSPDTHDRFCRSAAHMRKTLYEPTF